VRKRLLHYISDDDLKKIFSAIPKDVRLEVLLGSCHSGSATRGELLPLEQRIIPRFLTPPVDIRMREEDDLPVHFIAGSANPQGHVLFSGCRDNQRSADAYIKGAYNGAFTYYFCKHLRSAREDISRADLLKNLRASLKHEKYDQVPQLECPTTSRKKKLLE
jgi:metacaspase-1